MVFSRVQHTAHHVNELQPGQDKRNLKKATVSWLLARTNTLKCIFSPHCLNSTAARSCSCCAASPLPLSAARAAACRVSWASQKARASSSPAHVAASESMQTTSCEPNVQRKYSIGGPPGA